MEERGGLRRSDSCLLDSGVAESGEVEIPSCCDLPPEPRYHRSLAPGPVLVCSNTIRQHYYPEGGWGWLVLLCGILVQCLSHGIQLSWGILELEVRRKFPRTSIFDTGLRFQLIRK